MTRDRNKRNEKQETENHSKNIKEKVTEMLELPKEIVLNVPKLTMIGNGNLVIENYKGIIEYESTRIRINTAIGLIKVCGNMLSIKEITSEDLIIEGEINLLEFLK